MEERGVLLQGKSTEASEDPHGPRANYFNTTATIILQKQALLVSEYCCKYARAGMPRRSRLAAVQQPIQKQHTSSVATT